MIKSLRTRLVVQIGLMMGAVVLAGAAGVWGVNGMHQDFGEARAGYESLRDAYDIGVHVAIARAVLSDEAAAVEPARQALERARLGMELVAEEGDPEAEWMDTVQLVRVALAELAEPQPDRPRARQAIGSILSELGMKTTEGRLRIDRSAAAASERRREALGAVSLLAGAALVIVSLVGWAQYRSVIGPLNHIEAGVHRLARHDFGKQIEPVGDREFRRLSTDFNAMADELRGIYQDLERQVAVKSEALARSARLASVGYLAAGVAHEINNPLSIIAGYGERSLRQLDRGVEGGALREALGIVCEEAFRCREITSRLLALARPEPSERCPVRLSDVVRNVAASLGGLPGAADVTVQVEIGDQEEPVIAEPDAMKQVVLNLAVNALHAVRDRGEDGRVKLSVLPVRGGMSLVVWDNGVGMSSEVLEQAFEPFFTRRASAGDGGVGLGLTIVHAIVERHGGRLTAESDGLGRGSRFVVELPAVLEESLP